jgi:hypothetical protein
MRQVAPISGLAEIGFLLRRSGRPDLRHRKWRPGFWLSAASLHDRQPEEKGEWPKIKLV